jgi:hypothetical protein
VIGNGGSEQWERALASTTRHTTDCFSSFPLTMPHPAIATRRKPRKIRYHDQEWDEVMAHARACGLPPATFVRQVSLGATPRARRNRTENELIHRLGRIANDLHRLIRVPDLRGAGVDAGELQAVLEEALSAIRRIG